MATQQQHVTELLRAWAEGSDDAREKVVPLIYSELRRIAQSRLRGDADETLDATGLAHEAFLRLVEQHDVDWKSRGHFYAIAARMMRRILVDRHRARRAEKRGGNNVRVTLSKVDVPAPEKLDIALLNDALDKLSEQDERQATIVELRFFAGLTIDETAAVIEASVSTVKREWAVARAWLKREMER